MVVMGSCTAGGAQCGETAIAYPVMVPNLRGLQNALAAGATEIAIFAAASETFSRRHINCGIEQSIARFAAVAERARRWNRHARLCFVRARLSV
ncbi:MAG: hypothetical protein OD918_08175 [Gammaproteobacteria bacterium]